LYSQLKHWPDNFMVNGQLTTAAAVINFHDQVQITLPAEADDPQVATSFAPLKIIYEDNNWLVIDKPAYLSSVPGPSNRTDTVVNRVKGHWEKQHEQNMVPHIITRLDRDTQGLMLIAKHRLANIWANQQIAQHQIQKLYYALVSGNLTADHGIIDQPIGRPENSIAHQV
ncbi:RluA family pseudouridine synthase, partial [Lactobacillus sp. XV13L]|nr:RluA family pseudouridine synthase [Lactobacillus sp. XV13L]